MSVQSPIRIGTRGSLLALAQAQEVQTRLAETLDLPTEAFEIKVLQTTGDRVQDRPLGEIGGKGLFTKEIEIALARSEIDIAVHSMKDVPTQRPDAFVLECYLPREDPRDAFLSNVAQNLQTLPQGAVVGTSSLRRKAQLLVARPDLMVIEFRGNVETRLRKLGDGVADATFLAMAGLRRLGKADLITAPIPDDVMLPAVAQGAIGIECRADDDRMRTALADLNDPITALRVTAERAFLAGLDGSCQTPIAALAEISGDQITLRGQVIRLDGSEALSDTRTASIQDAVTLGQQMAQHLRSQMKSDFF